MKKWANLICSDYNPDANVDDSLLTPLLEEKGIKFQDVIWDEHLDWTEFDRVIVRSPWDYCNKYTKFIKTLSKISSQTQIDNSFSLMKWNSKKTYLRELRDAGIQIIPSYFWKPSDGISKNLAEHVENYEKFVIKPSIGAGASGLRVLKHTGEIKLESFPDQALEYICQPFIKNIQEEGEYSMIYFNNVLSHGILKTPKKGEVRCQEEFGSHIREIKVSEELCRWGETVLDQLPEKPLYSRVDFLMNEKREPMLMELELIEPCLYFSFSEGSAKRFITACENKGYC